MINTSIVEEWYRENATRHYPLAPTAEATSFLPECVLVGLDMGVPSSMLTVAEDPELAYTVFVRSVVITSARVRVIFAAIKTGESESEDIGEAIAYTTQLRDNNLSGISIVGYTTINTELRGITGKVFFGPVDSIISSGGVYELDASSGAVSVECIHPYPSSLGGIYVGGILLNGDITLQEGDGVTITASGNIINIAMDSPTTTGISSREDLLEAVVTAYGQPITTINGIPPNSTGNFSIGVDEGGCIEIGSTDFGITINNPCATPCCDKSLLEPVADNINQLNARAARLTSYLAAVTSNLNAVQNELAILKMHLKAQ